MTTQLKFRIHLYMIIVCCLFVSVSSSTYSANKTIDGLHQECLQDPGTTETFDNCALNTAYKRIKDNELKITTALSNVNGLRAQAKQECLAGKGPLANEAFCACLSTKVFDQEHFKRPNNIKFHLDKAKDAVKHSKMKIAEKREIIKPEYIAELCPIYNKYQDAIKNFPHTDYYMEGRKIKWKEFTEDQKTAWREHQKIHNNEPWMYAKERIYERQDINMAINHCGQIYKQNYLQEKYAEALSKAVNATSYDYDSLYRLARGPARCPRR